MKTFDTPEPISAFISLAAGSVRIIATDRRDTVVDVQPSDESRSEEIRAAEQTRIEFSNGCLRVTAPRNKDRLFLGRTPSLAVMVELPAGSALDVSAASADIDAAGSLGEVDLDVASGDARLEQVEVLRAKAASGDLSAARVTVRADVVTASGDIRIGAIDGPATLKSASGSISLREAGSDLRLQSASGDADVEHALADVSVRTASGDIRIRDVVHGSVQVESASGDLVLGVREGTAAWLDLKSLTGDVRNSLEAADGPEQSSETAEVRARSISGDILIQRASPHPLSRTA